MIVHLISSLFAKVEGIRVQAHMMETDSRIFPPTYKLENNASSQSMPLFSQQFATKSKKNDASANS